MDVALGARIRAVREESGISLKTLALECNLSFQQIRKYETGYDRVSFSRLCAIAHALDKTVINLIKPVVGKM